MIYKIKNTVSLLILLLIITACGSKKEIPELLEGNYRVHTVSFEESQPKINLDNDKLKDILILLHHRVSAEAIKKQFQLSDNVWNERINYLFGKGLIKKFDDSSFVPTVFVLDEENGCSLKKLTDSLGAEMSGIAIDRLNKIKEAYAKIPSFKNIPFDYASMFILGGVMHDDVQLKNYQDQFIKAFIPHRGNSYYYMSLVQNEEAESSNPKIYETRYYNYPAFTLGSFATTVYERNIATYATSELIKDFGRPATESDSVYQISMLIELIKMSKNAGYKPPVKMLDGFNRYEITAKGKPTVPVLSIADQQRLAELSNIVAQDIINYFENRQTLFVKWYLNSQYREEVSYKEWMIWVYKMITAKTIDVLVEKSYIKSFGGNTASFIFLK
ncbi:MAG: hypothetical protein Q8S39_02850 [Ignavibacteria bacterium]|nr:hypothetical protein [Ignavibacteria bacterium]